MAYKGKNVRNMKVTPETGKDFRDTNVTSGVAKPSRAFKATNSTEQYTVGAPPKGDLGGMNTNS